MNSNNIFEAKVLQLQLLQQRLIENKDANEQLSIGFSECLQKNLNYLEKNMPELYVQLTKFRITSKKVVCFENGEANLLDLKSGTLLYSDSPVDETKQQVERWLNGNNVYIKSQNAEQKDDFCQLHFYIQNAMSNDIDKFINEHNKDQRYADHEITQEVPLLVINGGGLGYPLLELCSKIEPKFIYYIEPDTEIFLCSLGVIDWSSILSFLKSNNQTINFFIGCTGKESFESYQKKVNLVYPFLQSYQLLFTHYDSKDTVLFLELFKNSISLGLNSNGMFDDAIFGINNIVENTKNYPYLKEIPHNRFQDLPVAVVANGPSLDDDLEYLKNHESNFIIVACGTAVTALDQCNIIPDFYIAVERVDLISESLKFVTNRKIFEQTVNISMNVVHPLTLSMFSHSIIVNKESESIQKLFKDNNNINCHLRDIMICSNTNPLVANCALSIFLNLNFRNYYLFGIDNGVLSENKVHSSKSLYFSGDQKFSDDEIMNTSVSSIALVPGNFGNKILANSLFNECRNKIEQEIQKHAESSIFNCSNGALIKGTIPVHSADLKITEDISEQKNDFKQFLLDKGSRKIIVKDIDILQIYDKSRFNKAIEEIINIWNTNNTGISKLDVINKMKLTVDYLNNTKYELENSLLSGSLKVYFSSIISSMYVFKSNELTVQLVNICLSHLITFLQLCRELYKNADKLIQGKHFDYEPEVVYANWSGRK